MDPLDQPSSPQERASTPLARRPDFNLGGIWIRPSLRTIEGPKGAAKGEPRVIQVLIALADARGSVLSREDLLRVCWGGRIVGDDAINRAIAEVRRITLAVGAGFEIETIPRIGYRLTGIDWPVESEAASEPVRREAISRRAMFIGGAAGAALLAGGGGAFLYRGRHSETDALIERGRLIQASGLPQDDRRAEALFRQAIERDPRRASAWGWLAVVLDDQKAAREAAVHALDLDQDDPNGRAVLAIQRLDLDSWTKWEDALLAVLADDPANGLVLGQLTLFYQGMGRCRDSWATNERAIGAEPFNAAHQHRRALKHWLFGRLGEADKVADQALRLWPRHSTVWNARMVIYAFTDRAAPALALLDDVGSRPERLTPPSVASWRAGLKAIATRAPADVANALEICTENARVAPGLAANAIMFFSHLGELDAAFQVAGGLFEGRGKVFQKGQAAAAKDLYSNFQWGRTQFLFIPATANFRADRRFPELCRRLGHLSYWRERGVWPDPFVRGAVDPAKLA